jgi:hypothetical protein
MPKPASFTERSDLFVHLLEDARLFVQNRTVRMGPIHAYPSSSVAGDDWKKRERAPVFTT